MTDNNSNQGRTVPKRILASLIASVSAGVVPRSGAPYIAIGRRDEIEAFLSDLELIADGGGTVRFLIGRYGSGKSFLMQLVRGYALDRDFICADADLSPERRLYGTGGTGVATYRELVKNMSVKSSPDGGGLVQVISRLIFNIRSALADKGIEPDSDGYGTVFASHLREKLSKLEFLVGGFDFARVITNYYFALESDDRDRQSACLRWLRGEFTSKTEARNELGFNVSEIINDANFYDYLKLWAGLSAEIGYRGFMVFIDECVNLYKIPHRVSRENNYEKILSIFNDTLQGRAPHLGIVFGGTPQFLEDTRRGLFSYEALRSRLCDTRFGTEGFRNLAGPVIRLKRLSDDELLALTVRMTSLHGMYYGWTPSITPEDQLTYLRSSLERTGADSMITPREMLRDLMTLLNILMQNPELRFADVFGRTESNAAASSFGSSSSDTAASSENDRSEGNENSGAAAFNPADIDF